MVFLLRSLKSIYLPLIFTALAIAPSYLFILQIEMRVCNPGDCSVVRPAVRTQAPTEQLQHR